MFTKINPTHPPIDTSHTILQTINQQTMKKSICGYVLDLSSQKNIKDIERSRPPGWCKNIAIKWKNNKQTDRQKQELQEAHHIAVPDGSPKWRGPNNPTTEHIAALLMETRRMKITLRMVIKLRILTCLISTRLKQMTSTKYPTFPLTNYWETSIKNSTIEETLFQGDIIECSSKDHFIHLRKIPSKDYIHLRKYLPRTTLSISGKYLLRTTLPNLRNSPSNYCSKGPHYPIRTLLPRIYTSNPTNSNFQHYYQGSTHQILQPTF